MKLLRWMHRKLQKDNTGSFTGSAGNSCLPLKPTLISQDDYLRQGNNSKLKCHNYIDGFNAAATIDISKEESAGIFPGFLTIGTLNVEPVTEPPPTFDLPHQKANEDGIAEIKYDLKLITEELEKFLRDEAEKEGKHKPSDRNSQASDATLIDNGDKVGDYKCIDMQEYPLQGYLLASSTKLSEIKQKEKAERASFQEVFQNNSTITNKSLPTEAEDTKKKAMKKLKRPIRILNKILQTTLICRPFSATPTDFAVESFPTMTKFSKIKRIFNKKIHPEISTAETDPNKCSKKKETDEILKSPSYTFAASALNCNNTRMGHWGTLMNMKEEKHQLKTEMKLCQHPSAKKKETIAPIENSSNASKEHWINTDADYLVLELQQNQEVPY